MSTARPTVSWIAVNGTGITNGSGDLNSGTVQLDVEFSKAVYVTGTPTITLNDGGTATYVSGSGTDNLVFNYTIGSGQNTPDLMVAAYNFGGIKGPGGGSVNLTGAPTWVTSGTLAIETTPPTVTFIAATGTGITSGNGDLTSGTVQLTLGLSEAVNVTGTPTLTLNDGGTASYVSGSGTNSLVFNYTIASGQNTSDLAVSTFNLSGVKDLAGNSVSLTGAPTNPAGTLVIGTTAPTAPTVTSIAASGTGITNGNGDLNSGTVQLTLGFSEAVNVTGTPTLTLNDGGTASYASGSGTNSLVFNYTIASGQNTSDLAVSTFNLTGVKDAAGNSVSLTGAPTNPAGTLAIGTTAPTVASIAASGTGITNGNGDLSSGTVQLTLGLSEAVNVTGAPTLTLNDGGTASYASGSGTNSLVFNYTIGSGQNTSDLAVSTFNLAGVNDAAGNSVSLTGAPTNPAGTLVIGTTAPTAPTVTSIAASGTGITNGNGDLSSGTVQLTLGLSEAVNVTGTPTLTLNDGGTASYASGSGTNSLVFNYTIGSGQNTSDLAVSTFNLTGVKDAAGNSVSLTGAPTNPAGTLAIGTTAPTVASIAASGTGITNGNGDLSSGTVQLALGFSEAVNVTGTPTLTLNDGGTASYASGSGTNSLVFNYTIASGQNTSDLAVSTFNLTGVKDAAGNSVSLTGAPTNPAGTLAIGTTAPTVASIAASGTGITNGNGDLSSGTVQLALGFSEAVNVTGTPTLTLNDGGTASYVSGSGSNSLVFNYTIGSGQTTSDLAVSTFNLTGVKDSAGNSVSLTGAPTNPPGTLVINDPTGGNPGSFNLATDPFSSTSEWNEPVATNATYTKLNWPGSTGYNYTVNWDTYSPAVYEAASTDPIVQVSVPAGWGYPGGTISVQMPTAANGAAGTDGELVVISGGIAYNFWQFDRTSATTATASAYGEANVTTGTGWGTSSPFLSAGITAAGTSELGGLLVQAETDTGTISHALQLVVDSTLVEPGAVGEAISSDGGSSSGIVQEGELLAIPKGTPMPSGLSALGQEVFTALQNYGAYVIDVAGGCTALRVQSNAYSAATITALQQDMGSVMPLLEAVSGGTAGTMAAAAMSPIATSSSDLATDSINVAAAPTTPPATLAVDTSAPTVMSTASSGTAPAANSVNLSAAPTETPAPGVDAAAPTVASVTTAPSSDSAGTMSPAMSEGTQNGSSPQVAGIVLPTASSITDLAGNNAILSGAAASPTPTGGQVSIYGSTELNLFGPSAEGVSFASGASGDLKLDASSQFVGSVAGFAGQDKLDLADIAFGRNTTLGYAANSTNTGGTLTVSDGTVTAKIALLGQYTASSFVTSADSSGGTLIQAAASSALTPTLTKSQHA